MDVYSDISDVTSSLFRVACEVRPHGDKTEDY